MFMWVAIGTWALILVLLVTGYIQIGPKPIPKDCAVRGLLSDKPYLICQIDTKAAR